MGVVVDLDTGLFAAEADGFVILRDLLLTVSGPKIERLAIGPTGVFMIASRPWTVLPEAHELEADVMSQIQLASLVFKMLADGLIAYAASVRPVIVTNAVTARVEVLEVGVVSPTLLSQTILHDEQEMDLNQVQSLGQLARKRFTQGN